MKIRKDVLYAGTYHLPDGRIFRCKAEEIPHYRRRMADMMATGLSIPVAWEHQSKAKPETQEEYEQVLADKTRNVMGRADGVLEGGNVLEMKLDIPNASDAERLPAVGFVSPKIEWDFKDSTGRVWPGPSITHIAVTARPVQHLQKPFVLSQEKKSVLTSPSFLPFIPKRGANPAPVYLSLASVQLGANPMADEKIPDDAGEAAPPAPAPVPAPMLEPQGPDKLKQAVQALAGLNLILGNDVTEENFFDRVVVALHTKAAHEAKDETTPKPDEAPKVEAETPPITEAPMPMMMSLQAQLQAAEQRASAAEAIIANERKGHALSRIARLRGFLPNDECDKLAAALNKEPVSLSLAPSQSPTLIQVAAYEKAAKLLEGRGGFVQLSDVTEVEPPEAWTKPQDRHGDVAEATPEEIEKATEYLTRGRYKAQKTAK